MLTLGKGARLIKPFDSEHHPYDEAQANQS
jgi:hypothetical protein